MTKLWLKRWWGPQLRRWWLAAALVVCAWLSWQVGEADPDKAVSGPSVATPARVQPPPARSTPASDIPLVWPKQAITSAPVPDLFAAENERPDRNKPPAPAAPASQASVPVVPPVPEFSFKYAGRLLGEDGNFVFLLDGSGRLVQTMVGQSLAGGWQLSEMDSGSLRFRNTETGQEKILAIGTNR